MEVIESYNIVLDMLYCSYFFRNKLQYFVSALSKTIISNPTWKLAFGKQSVEPDSILSYSIIGCFWTGSSGHTLVQAKRLVKKIHTEDNDVEPD